jgi:hypothetical protein
MMQPIVTYVHPPIPLRSFDYCACFNEEEGLYGWGRTKEEAIDDLLQLTKEDRGIMNHTKCFACDRSMKGREPYLARVKGETTVVYVGHDCFAHIHKGGRQGYQPPSGGPRLFDSDVSIEQEEQPCELFK